MNNNQDIEEIKVWNLQGQEHVFDNIIDYDIKGYLFIVLWRNEGHDIETAFNIDRIESYAIKYGEYLK